MGKILLQGSTILRKIYEGFNDEQVETGFFIMNPLTMLGTPKDELSGNDGIKRRVRHEIKKDFFEYINDNAFDYIVLDLFTAAQLDSYKFDGNFYSGSLAFIESDFFLIHKNEMTKTAELKLEENWKPLLKEFAERLLEVFDKEKIILNRVRIHERGIQGKNLIKGEEKTELNKRLSAMEDYFIQIVDPKIVDICNDYFIDLDQSGTAFEPLYYVDAMNNLMRVANGTKRTITSGNASLKAKRIVRYFDSIIETKNYSWIVPDNQPVSEIIENSSKLFVAEHQDLMSLLILNKFDSLETVYRQFERTESMKDFIDEIKLIIDKKIANNKKTQRHERVGKSNKEYKPEYFDIDVVNVIKTISADQVEQYIDKAYEKKKTKLKVPGFRAGAVPKNVAMSYYGSGYFFDEASRLCIKDTEHQTITTSGQIIVSVPESKVIEVSDDRSFKYQTTAKVHKGFYDLKKNAILYLRQRIEPITTLADDVNYIVFFSVSNMEERAQVFCGVGKNPEQAVTIAAQKLSRNYTDKISKDTVIKVDMVSSVMEIRSTALSQFMRRATFEKFFRYGISFDNRFEDALLEEEMNAYQIYDYKNWDISLERIKKYRGLHNQNSIDNIPEKIYLFEVQSLFVQSDGDIVNLYGEVGLNKGRRIQKQVNKSICKSVVGTSTKYLLNQINEDGSFVYGYYPSFDKPLKSYNILRHLGTAWSMMCADDILKDKHIKTGIDKVLTNAIDNYIEYKDDDTAYVVERKADEIKLGGNGIAVIAMTKYMDNYGGNQYLELVGKLANGIVQMQDAETGRYNHVLNFPDHTIKEAMRTVYYDGESTYALVCAYEYTHDERYLQCAKKALDYQIDNNYIRYRDHWLAYAFNAYIKHDLSQKYVDFALRNAKDNLVIIRNQATSYHTYQELLTMTLDTYLYAKEHGYSSEYFEKYNLEELTEVIRHRAWHMLDGYWYPEYAMYMACPKRILGSFFVRHDGFRTRIDDDQHFIDGYVKYAKLYSEINR